MDHSIETQLQVAGADLAFEWRRSFILDKEKNNCRGGAPQPIFLIFNGIILQSVTQFIKETLK